MKSLAFSKAEQKERNSPKTCTPYEGDKYPYGLRLDLNSDVMKKLDVSSLPKTGGEVTIRAKAKVVSTSINDRDGKQEKRMELQIIAMEIDMPEASAEDAIFDGMPKA
jgi:hypothetical protein